MPIVPVIVAILSLLPGFSSLLRGKGSKRVLIHGATNAAVNMLAWAVAHITDNVCSSPSQKLCSLSFNAYWVYVFITIVNAVLVPMIWQEALARRPITSRESIAKVAGISIALFVTFIFAVIIFAAYALSRG
jgi:hypothetical protein